MGNANHSGPSRHGTMIRMLELIFIGETGHFQGL